MIAHMLRRLGALISGPPRVDYGLIPPSLLRDVGLADPHARLIGTSPREGEAGPAARPFSFRIHPVSELVELRDRSAVASLPVLRHNLTHPQAA